MADLYSKLRSPESAAYFLNKTINHYFESIKNKECPIQQISNEAMKSYQKRLIESKSTNPIISDALRGEKTVEQRTTELYEAKNKGIWKYLPRRKDEQYNHEAEKLEEINWQGGNLKTKGILSATDNATNLPVYCATVFGAVPLLIVAASQNYSQNNLDFLYTFSTIGFTLGVFISLLELICRKEMKNSLIEQAKYIDKKIEELF